MRSYTNISTELADAGISFQLEKEVGVSTRGGRTLSKQIRP